MARFDLLAWEYDLFGDFSCDLVVGDSVRKAFNFIEFEGDRPDENEATDVEPNPNMIQSLADLATTVIMAKHNNVHHVVPMDSEAMSHMREFSRLCDTRIRGDDDVQAQL